MILAAERLVGQVEGELGEPCARTSSGSRPGAEELEAGKRREVARSIDRAKTPWLAYLEAVESGEEESDPEREAELVAAIREAEAPRSPSESYGRGDRRRLRAARGAGRRQPSASLEAAEAAVARYIRQRFDALAVALAVDSRAASEHMQAAWAELRSAEQGWYEALRPWRALLEAVNMDPAAETPEHPLRDLAPGVEERIAKHCRCRSPLAAGGRGGARRRRAGGAQSRAGPRGRQGEARGRSLAGSGPVGAHDAREGG